MFGGYAGLERPHDITLRNITVLASVHRVAPQHTTDHAVYFSYALDTWGGILIDNLTVEAQTRGLSSAIHMDHGYASDAPNVAAHGVTVRNLTFHGNTTIAGQQAIILWQPPIHDWLFDGGTITTPAVRRPASSPSVRRTSCSRTSCPRTRMGSTAAIGSNPPGVTFTNTSLALTAS